MRRKMTSLAPSVGTMPSSGLIRTIMLGEAMQVRRIFIISQMLYPSGLLRPAIKLRQHLCRTNTPSGKAIPNPSIPPPSATSFLSRGRSSYRSTICSDRRCGCWSLRGSLRAGIVRVGMEKLKQEGGSPAEYIYTG